MVLAEDGTIVDDEDYFLCLPSNTKFVALAKGERWSGKSAGSGGAGRLFPAGRNGGGERSCRVRAGLRGAVRARKGPRKEADCPRFYAPDHLSGEAKPESLVLARSCSVRDVTVRF